MFLHQWHVDCKIIVHVEGRTLTVIVRYVDDGGHVGVLEELVDGWEVIVGVFWA